MTRRKNDPVNLFGEMCRQILDSRSQESIINGMERDLEEIAAVILCQDPECTAESHLEEIAEILDLSRELMKQRRRRRALPGPKTIEAVIVDK